MSSAPEPLSDVVSRGGAWAELLRRTAAGDEKALATFYDQSSALIFGLVLRITNERTAAEDVLLEVYTQVWQQAGRYDPARGSPLAWLTTIARTRALDRMRSAHERRRSKHVGEEQADRVQQASDPAERSHALELHARVRRAMASLPREQAEVIELSYFEGLSHTEIAERCGLPAGTVKTRIRLGMQKLRDALGPLVNGSGPYPGVPSGQ